MSTLNKPRRGQELAFVSASTSLVFGTDLFLRFLDDIDDSIDALEFLNTTGTELNDITSAINTTNKNKKLLDIVAQRYVYPDGPTAADLWYYADGSLANTPV